MDSPVPCVGKLRSQPLRKRKDPKLSVAALECEFEEVPGSVAVETLGTFFVYVGLATNLCRFRWQKLGEKMAFPWRMPGRWLLAAPEDVDKS